MINKLTSFLNIRREETRPAALLLGVMLFSAAGYSLGGTGIEALYFARYGTELLPYLYMGLGILSLITTLLITGLLGRVKRERMYVLIPFVAAIFLVIAWGLLFSKSKFIYPALWLGKESLNTIISMIAWNTAGAVCDSRQAKRLFPLFNAARILGSVLGGVGTGALVNLIGTQNLVLVWALSMFASFGMSRMLMGGKNNLTAASPKRRPEAARAKRRSPSFINEMKKGWHYVRGSSLMRWMSVAAILFSVLYFSIALPFSRSAAAQYPNENELAAFLGLFNGLSTAAAFITSIFFANRLYARFGIMNMILAFPIIYLLGFGALTLLNIFSVIVIFRFVQTLWLSGVADAAYQTMFSAVPPEKRDQVNAFLNGVPEQAGVFLAGGILIVGEQSFTSQQLYMVGLAAAAATSFIILRASSAYRGALVSSLREGRPAIFSGRATTHDSTSLTVALDNIKNPDPLVRRVAVEMLGEMNSPEALISALQDEDLGVRSAALKGLTHHPPAILEVSALLNDPEPAARQQAIRTLRHLSPYPRGLGILLEPKLQDENPHVQIEAALGLLKINEHSQARELVRSKCVDGSLDERVHALNAMSELGDREAYALIAEQLDDKAASIRRAAAIALASCGEDAIPTLVGYLNDEDFSAREGVALALARIGRKSTPPVIQIIDKPAFSDGALTALEHLPIQGYESEVKKFSIKKIEAALQYHKLGLELNEDGNERMALLCDSTFNHSRRLGLQALRALSLLHDRESIQVAVENLQSKSPTQKANALEALEAAHDSRLIKPLLRVWESPDQQSLYSDYAQGTINQLLQDPDEWLRNCASFVLQGELMNTHTLLPIMERVLFLRRVPLLADLSPSDLQRVAELVTEHHAEKDDVIFEQGEAGEEMFVIVHGEVKVMISTTDMPEKEVARRKSGDVVGEMSIISGEPRIATLLAVEESHFLCLDKKSFEGLLRERPEVSLAIMRVLCARLEEATMQRPK
ncbi:MAG: HEAT repeat domain-containing protein [Chloroflexi bacterium]|nr:HEAT repeat domain-containing protein [Chloroflexota bacterium]